MRKDVRELTDPCESQPYKGLQLQTHLQDGSHLTFSYIFFPFKNVEREPVRTYLQSKITRGPRVQPRRGVQESKPPRP